MNFGIIVLFLVTMGSLLVFMGMWSDEPGSTMIGFIAFLFAAAITITCCIFNPDEKQEKIDNMIANGAEAYLNGKLVDITKIDIKYYYVTIKDDYILLTTRN